MKCSSIDDSAFDRVDNIVGKKDKMLVRSTRIFSCFHFLFHRILFTGRLKLVNFPALGFPNLTFIAYNRKTPPPPPVVRKEGLTLQRVHSKVNLHIRAV